MAALRADAQRNRDRVLEAAAEVFAAQGTDVNVNEIARRAGVGHGTVFRRFPTKEALIAAVVTERLNGLADSAEGLLDHPDAGLAFEAFVWDVAELHARDRGLFVGVPRCSEMPEVAAAKARLLGLAGRLVSRAQDEGSLRRDVDADDVTVLIGSTITGSAYAAGSDAWRRFITVVIDGLRAPVAPPGRRDAPRPGDR